MEITEKRTKGLYKIQDLNQGDYFRLSESNKDFIDRGLYLFISLKNIIDLKSGESLTDDFFKDKFLFKLNIIKIETECLL